MNKHNASFCQSPRLFQPPRLLTLEILAKLPVYYTLPILLFWPKFASLPVYFVPPLLFKTREYEV